MAAGGGGEVVHGGAGGGDFGGEDEGRLVFPEERVGRLVKAGKAGAIAGEEVGGAVVHKCHVPSLEGS